MPDRTFTVDQPVTQDVVRFMVDGKEVGMLTGLMLYQPELKQLLIEWLENHA